ncbi:MAG: Fic family protein [Terriglobales bacterium]
MSRSTGIWLQINTSSEPYRAFLPSALPPDPPVRLEPILPLLSSADRAVGRLDGICSTLPDADLFLFVYVRKEAVLSSQIEGTQSSLSDLLLFENNQPTRAPREDVAEVSRYVAAMNHGLKRLRQDRFPLSLRLIREMHSKLLQSGRGAEWAPGEFRTSQNWIGGSRPGNAAYVPPPPEHVLEKMGELENFFHVDDLPLPLLIRAAMAHVQFESIHPFLDGNGRIGRLLIPLLLCEQGAIREPILYPSLFFKQHRDRYYELLQGVRTHGDWESWVEFFLRGIAETADQAVETARQILSLQDEDRSKLAGLGRARLSAGHIYNAILKSPIFSIPVIAEAAGLSYPATARAVANMQRLKLIERFAMQSGPQVFAYQRYLNILNQGAEPLPR